MKTNKRPESVEIYPKNEKKLLSKCGSTSISLTAIFHGTRWKQLTRSLLVNTPHASHAIVDFDDGSFVKISI